LPLGQKRVKAGEAIQFQLEIPDFEKFSEIENFKLKLN